MFHKYKKSKIFKKIQPGYHYLKARVSAFVFGYPSNKMLIIGVTGTTGKSSTCYFVAQILEKAGFKVGMTTTTLFKIGEKEWLNEGKMTMLGGFAQQKILDKMRKEKCEVVVVETSSQGVEQYRHLGVNYDFLVFTNLFPEHIEAHGGFENYKQAKGKLFAYLSRCKAKNFKNPKLQNIQKAIIANLDDKYANYFLNFKADRKIGFKINSERTPSELAKIYQARNIQSENGKMVFEIEDKKMKTNILGRYNIYNILVGYSVVETLGIPDGVSTQAIANLKPLPGRLEFIDNEKDIQIVVDYAFEPKAMKSLYETVQMDLEYSRIIHVLGSCGGGIDPATQRDKSRRPVLGRLAGENADVVIVTNEDPYDEDPQSIIDQVLVGVKEIQNRKQNLEIYQILDRKEAIKKAIETAMPGDLVLVTGKGAEQVMCLPSGEMITWDDREVIREILVG
jgi:UDP-N-acetylmuramoyl-L-alanyl-D-glutamate--2,6-diaminopimelate ligase